MINNQILFRSLNLVIGDYLIIGDWNLVIIDLQ
jgi:hypothetical protein